MRQPRRRPSGGDLRGDEGEQKAADQRNRRRHRQAIGETEQHHEQGESPPAEDRDDVGDRQPLAGMSGKRDENLGGAGFGGQIKMLSDDGGAPLAQTPGKAKPAPSP